eukprot:Gregarina_sp_Poly_1__8565@NODE_507_length_7855_cov_144_722779_g405_i0_p6_GENE_NODE_507_length_7855_cov_144_722779_g405_i0NODE_507_length_7855_cov_144_722779_g405_i0_p6_ORF_typecomplete_len145_score11_58TatD_DNase/PF01026_21/2_6e24Amidohydro_2/PF04909_14/0_019_NODE_507_length_7855_cov_144_722779_g405_i068587292
MAKGGVIHSFDGTVKDVQEALDMGLAFGLNGCSIRESMVFESIKAMPQDRIHFETDAPWCSIKSTHASMPLLKWSLFDEIVQVKPEKYSPTNSNVYVKGRNEPSLIHQVAEAVFKIRNSGIDCYTDFVNFTKDIYQNSCKLFSL